jgi:hypothetical protein
MYNFFMVKYKGILYIVVIILFLGISFYPTYFELKRSDSLSDPSREFILEHNFYWPDYNLYLSKIRQGFEGRWTGLEKYTSEQHKGSLIQEFYVVLGEMGRIANLNPNYAYQLGRIILSPALMIVILLFILYFFKKTFWQITALLITLASGSFPRFFEGNKGALEVGRYMEWWSNIDAVQRITFIPHILFGQVISLFLLYQLLVIKPEFTPKKLLFYSILANLAGLVFPPSLITLIGVIFLMITIESLRIALFSAINLPKNKLLLKEYGNLLLFCVFSIPSLFYIFIMTKQLPWSALVDFHRTHPMMIPFWDYILGTGPIFFLGLTGAALSVINKDRKFQPLIYWIMITFGFALVFTYIKEQSPLRFTQTGLFIPLGILGTYLFMKIWEIPERIFSYLDKSKIITDEMGGIVGGTPNKNANRQSEVEYLMGVNYDRTHETEQTVNNPQIITSEQTEIKYILKTIIFAVIFLYIVGNFYIMISSSVKWQTNFITQRANASVPAVPFPPQTMYPLKEWMDGIRWLRDNTNHDDVVLAMVTAGNHIPAYSGNFVYFGQSNTVNYETKQILVNNFFEGRMGKNEADLFFKNGRIKYIFFSVQEKEQAKGAALTKFYPQLKEVYKNPTVTIYSTY